MTDLEFPDPPHRDPTDSIGPYRILRELGHGGMGVVYLAHDPRLNRDVALKALPLSLARDRGSLDRFEREAKLLASLHHANIAAVHDLVESDGRRFLVMEYVAGETLAERLARGPLPIAETLRVGAGIAAGMEAAHEARVVHRDLTPGNIVLAPDGTPKILDFGLAKSRGFPSAAPDADAPTAAPATLPGMILGTAAYLSPEQARGQIVDRRTDIWALGCILYECLRGARAFEAGSFSDIIAAILDREPEYDRLPRATPAGLVDLIRRCLVKDPRRRLRDIGDARLILEDLGALDSRIVPAGAPAETGSGAAALGAIGSGSVPTRRRRSVLLLGAAITLVVGGILGIGAYRLARPERRPSVGSIHLTLPVPPDLDLKRARITPDGSAVVLQGHPREPRGDGAPDRLYVRRLDGEEFVPLAGTEGVVDFLLSRDSRWIQFAARVTGFAGAMQVLKVPVDGSLPPVTVVRADPAWSGQGAWLSSGDFLVPSMNRSHFVRVPAGGGAPGPPVLFRAPARAGTFEFTMPLPGDRTVLLDAFRYTGGEFRVSPAALDLRTNRVRILLDEGDNPRFIPPDLLLFSRGTSLLAARFDPRRVRVIGEPVAVADGLRTTEPWGSGSYSVSSNATLVYRPGGFVGGNRRAVVAGPKGAVTSWSEVRGAYESFAEVSPDGSQLAVMMSSPKPLFEIWVLDRGGVSARRVAAMEGADCVRPVWSPDGRWIAFSRFAEDDSDGVYLVPSDGSAPPRWVFRYPMPLEQGGPSSWSPDGRSILVSMFFGGQADVELVPVPEGDHGPANGTRLFSSPAREYDARYSPDGTWMAHVSNETGADEIYICAVHPDGTVGPSVQVSAGGGTRPHWSADGKRLVYVAPGGRLLATTIRTDPSISASEPVPLWDLSTLQIAGDGMFDLLPDGRLVLIRKGPEEERPLRALQVVLHVDREVRRRLAGPGPSR